MPFFPSIPPTLPYLRPPWSSKSAPHRASIHPLGDGSVAILRSMSPNSRRVRCARSLRSPSDVSFMSAARSSRNGRVLPSTRRTTSAKCGEFKTGWAGAWGIRTLSGDCPVSKISGPLAASRPKWLQDARNGAGGNGESALSSSSAGRPRGGMRADQSFRRQATRLTQRAQFFSNALPIASNAVNCSISNGTLQ
jgi:hypothetical protein